MHPKELRIDDYTYDLPDELIAKYPLEIRDASKLLIYEQGKLTEDNYNNIAAHIPADTLMVFNQTRVVNARLLFKKESGSVIEVFCLEPHSHYADIQTAMGQKGHVLWQCMIGGAAKWKHGMVLTLQSHTPLFTLSAKIVERLAGTFIVELRWDNDSLSFAEVLQSAGRVPLPPYMHRQPEQADTERYQTVFAREEGSVAAPTAGLHFTKEVLRKLHDKNIQATYVTLHVGAGTFKPVSSDTMEEHEMHAEWMEVSTELIEHLLLHLDKKIIAVGTTSLRTLESLYHIGNLLVYGVEIDFAKIAIGQWVPYEHHSFVSAKNALLALLDHLKEQKVGKLITRTQILIAPGYAFRLVSGLVTNFHQPKSTLLLLVSAFIGDDWRKLYNHALENEYRFLSYGDGCLLWR